MPLLSQMRCKSLAEEGAYSVVVALVLYEHSGCAERFRELMSDRNAS